MVEVSFNRPPPPTPLLIIIFSHAPASNTVSMQCTAHSFQQSVLDWGISAFEVTEEAAGGFPGDPVAGSEER